MVLCAHIRLGTKNRSILSLEALRQHGLHVVGATFIGKTNDDTMKTLGDFFGDLGILAVCPFCRQFPKSVLQRHLPITFMSKILPWLEDHARIGHPTERRNRN
ncbi:AAA family ATPase [Cohaesibacter gelatinilyticus]|uniref:AAA family ATPase n=1 Tax=Cohaesibacter gelatinilyticus TaxID=372072 RepID=UPI000BE3AA92